MLRSILFAAAVAIAASAATADPAAAKVCKDPLSAKSRSTAGSSDAARDRAASSRAATNWSRQVRKTHGIAYQYWFRASDKDTKCFGTEKSRTCVVRAKPCRIV